MACAATVGHWPSLLLVSVHEVAAWRTRDASSEIVAPAHEPTAALSPTTSFGDRGEVSLAVLSDVNTGLGTRFGRKQWLMVVLIHLTFPGWLGLVSHMCLLNHRLSHDLHNRLACAFSQFCLLYYLN
ncbi:hypothetical protein N657DRAFT_359843 [Parathielavia appendiculata]|uniref:Secreted protein n=1 Tax=Parathielavia appendiculata TaxID=2587402 RepID=A0AAN6U2E4_9PEZI|nr:hypothetical protein N657DRAFT_359843 [Parathielavia appendiculata]